MTSSRWWSVAMVATCIVLGGVVATTSDAAWEVVVGIAALVALLASWFTFGRGRTPDSPRAIALIALVVAIALAGSTANPSFAIIQCIAYPLVWTSFDRLRTAIVANVAIAVAVAVGMYLSAGADRDALLLAVITEAISLAFSVGLGLWITGIADQSDERKRLLDELQAAQAELAVLSRDAGVTSERERLARDIHDTIAQDLTGIVLIAQRAARELDTGGDVAASLSLLEENAREALAETRALVASTASPGLEAGVAAAVARLAERFQRETGIAVDVDVAEIEVDRDTEVVLLRCAQEGLANVRKHAGASSVRLALAGRELSITDDGRGFDASAASSGFGLAGMRERLALVGGTVDIASDARGTRLRVTA